ncbi:Beclin 1-associated autophagy-related key like protein [Argiope bruennichi]|uniref:Beclin 1-associated autophagy-related key like protein n=1 Tax=Argiope bruennichi TaxID=94029 RepID=A0A8T0ETI6_ARGBR|nr:Beclin 1-associated autophagy-related key like protein [Argiope bruennichi]
MANSSDEGLDESIPEMVYQCISFTDIHIYKREDSYLKCDLCSKLKKHFYCADCIRNGNFTHSKTTSLERFADKKPKKYKVDEEKNRILKRCSEILAQKKEVENMKFNIERYKEKIELLDKSIKDCKLDISKDKKLISDLKEKKCRLTKRQKLFAEKLTGMENYSKLMEDDVKGKKSELQVEQSALDSLIQKRSQELVKYIFPIVPSSNNKDSVSSERQKKAELQEAQTFTYVQGNWTYDNPSDNTYSIVQPFLITGDYSADTNWSEKMELTAYASNMPSEDRYYPAYVISAALAYEAQLVSTMTYIMDCHVPRRTCFNDFCKYENLEKFSHAVAKLNANIINLCIARQVDLTKLRPNGTMSNLLALIYPEKNKDAKSFTSEEREEIIKSLEDPISQNLLPINDSDDDNIDDIEAEFVHVSDEEVPASLPVPVPEPVPMHQSFISSWWKAALGQR